MHTTIFMWAIIPVYMYILANIFLIEFLRKFGKGSEDSLWSRASQGQDLFERSRVEKFLSWFLGVLPRCKKSELFLFNGIYNNMTYDLSTKENKY